MCTAAHGSSFTSSQLCWAAPHTTTTEVNAGLDSGAFVDCSFANGSQTVNQSTPNPNGGPDQTFNATATTIATADTWKVSIDLDVENYRRDMYQTSSTSDGNSWPTTAVATAGFSDSLDVTSAGGPGVYSLNYIFSIDGSLTASDPSIFDSSLCATLSLPEGTGTQTSACISNGQSVPSTFTLTYADLEFGAGPITPTITINAYGGIEPIQPGVDDTLFSGSLGAHFGSTIHLTSILVTDANGNPLQGVTLNSASGFQYPLDPDNQTVPEPTGLSILGMTMLAGVGLLRRSRKASRSAEKTSSVAL
jgi:hypothetical protein